MIDTIELVKNAMEKKPSEFNANFASMVQDRVANMLATRKLDLSSTLFGAPEAVDDEIPAIDTTGDNQYEPQGEPSDGDKDQETA